MSDLTTWLTEMIGRRPATEPKLAGTPTPAPAACGQPGCDDPDLHAHVIRVVRPEPEASDPSEPTPTHYEAAYGEVEQHREDITLDELANDTADTDPWTAAMKLFGGQR